MASHNRLFMGSFDYSINYQLDSDFQEDGACKFINNFKAEIFVQKSSGTPLKVGRFNFSIVLVNQIIELNKSPLDVLQEQEELIHICSKFIRLDNGQFLNDINAEQKGNLCIIHDLDLLPGFRGKGIGVYTLTDFLCRFKSMFSTLCIQVVPFQTSVTKRKRIVGENLDDFTKSMRYEDGSFDEETVQLKLYAFFQKLGFSYYKDNLFYLNTAEMSLARL